MLFRVPVVQIHNTLPCFYLTWAEQELKGFVSFHPGADSLCSPFSVENNLFIQSTSLGSDRKLAFSDRLPTGSWVKPFSLISLNTLISASLNE